MVNFIWPASNIPAKDNNPPAAVNIWDGSTDGDWSDATNWSEGAVPQNQSKVVFNATSVDVNDGLNQSAITIRNLLITEQYTGDIGSSATPLQLNGNVLSINKSTGSVNLSGNWAAVYVYTIPAGGISLTGDFTLIHVRNGLGTLTIGDSSGISSLEIQPSRGGSALITIGDSVTNTGGSGRIGSIRAHDSVGITAQSGTDELDLIGPGELTLTGDGSNNNARVAQGATYNHQSSGKPADGILKVFAPNSTLFTLKDNSNTTITIDELDLLGGVADLANGRAAAVATVINSRGGRIYVDEDVGFAP